MIQPLLPALKSTDSQTGGGRRLPFRCLFIGGCPRSGTTLMQAILMRTGVVATATETHLFPQYVEQWCRIWESYSGKKSEGHRDVGLHKVLSDEDFEKALKKFCDTVFVKIQGKKRKPFVCEKTPENMLAWKHITRLYPKATIIHVVRDPRAVVASTMAAREWAAEWAHVTVGQICQRWMRYLDAAEACQAAGVSLIEARYERIATQDTGYIAKFLAQIGIQRSRAEAKDLCAAVEIGIMKERVKKHGAFFHGEPEGFFRRGETDSWREELSETDIGLIESLAGDHMQRLGYALVSKG